MFKNNDLYIKKFQIYDSLFNENSLDKILNIAENLLKNPIFILDTSYRIINRSNLAKTENSFIETHNGENYLLLDTIKLMKKEKCIDTIYSKNNAFFHHSNQSLIFCSIKINDITISYICVTQSKIKFQEDDLELINSLSKVISMQMQKESLFISNSGLDEEYYLMDLLINKIENIEYTKERLQNINFNFNENFLIISIPFKQTCADYRHNFGLKELIKKLKNILGNCISTYYNDMIIFLVSNNHEEVITNYKKESVIEFLKLNNLKCGISIIFEDLFNIQDFFYQSVYSLRILESLNIKDNIIYFQDYIEYYLFHISRNTNSDSYKINLSTLIHPWINKLLIFDKKNKTELLKTLNSYFENNRNANATSKKLNIHKSTFFYRFHKAQDLLGVRLDNSKNLFNLELSFKLLNYNNFIEM